MVKEILAGLIKSDAQQFDINPRNLRVLVLLDEEESTLARIDASTFRDLLRQQASRRVLRVKLGNVAYDIDLGSTAGSDKHSVPKRVRQRGYRDE